MVSSILYNGLRSKGGVIVELAVGIDRAVYPEVTSGEVSIRLLSVLFFRIATRNGCCDQHTPSPDVGRP